MLSSLPLFHRIAGQPVIVLGQGEAADAKRRLVERAGGMVVDDLAHGVDVGARLAFVAHEDEASALADAIRARGAGLLVNVVDRPALCDFTTPSIVDRDPVIIAVGTAGASAGLAKSLRLRLERLLPQTLGDLARALYAGRDAIKGRFPTGSDRRRALDHALDDGGPLDPFREHAPDAVATWVEHAATAQAARHVVILRSADPDDLTLREARLLGQADAVIAGAEIPGAIIARARADAMRVPPESGMELAGIVVELRFPAE